jgi:peptidoglycan-associated lipoprotein
MTCLGVMLISLLVYACGPLRVAAPSTRGQDLIVLLPQPDGAVGGVTVSSGSAAVGLSSPWDSTVVARSRPPAAVIKLDAGQVERIFGDALSALPSPPRHFSLHFQFASDELTAESRALVPEILRIVKERPVPDVMAVGHTDTTGSSSFNYELGLKRAIIVRDLLVGTGLDSSLVEVTSHGERDLAIRTADETYEAGNRRVEIEVR